MVVLGKSSSWRRAGKRVRKTLLIETGEGAKGETVTPSLADFLSVTHLWLFNEVTEGRGETSRGCSVVHFVTPLF